MDSSSIIIPPDVVKLINERHQIRQAFDESRTKATALDNFSGQVSYTGISPAQFMGALTTDATPPRELVAVFPRLEQELSLAQQIKTSIHENQLEIESIRQKAQTLMIWLIISGVVAAIILLLLLLHAVGVF